MEEIIRLEATLVEPEEGIRSNIAALQAQCLDMAEEMRGAQPIHTPEEYKEAKAMRAAVRKAVKQVEDERKRVKVAWTAPLTTFEASVKGALFPLSEVESEWDNARKDYEARARMEKYGRMKAYWEGTYPALALCTVGEPLVPFERAASCISKELKNMSEMDEGRDPIATRKLDDLADTLARGAETISGLNEPAEVVTMAMSGFYRTFDVVRSIDAAKREHERNEGMRMLGGAQAETGVPEVPRDEPGASVETVEYLDGTVINVDVTEGGESPVQGYEMPEKGSFEPVGYICIPVRDRGHMEAVIDVLKGAGISGSYRSTERVVLK